MSRDISICSATVFSTRGSLAYQLFQEMPGFKVFTWVLQSIPRKRWVRVCVSSSQNHQVEVHSVCQIKGVERIWVIHLQTQSRQHHPPLLPEAAPRVASRRVSLWEVSQIQQMFSSKSVSISCTSVSLTTLSPTHIAVVRRLGKVSSPSSCASSSDSFSSSLSSHSSQARLARLLIDRSPAAEWSIDSKRIGSKMEILSGRRPAFGGRDLAGSYPQD